jgi:hypothetical protein
MMPVLSRGDAVRDTPGSIPNRNLTTEQEFSGKWVNKGNTTVQPQPEALEEDGKQESIGAECRTWEETPQPQP